MATMPDPIRAPRGAIGWTPALGYAFDDHELPAALHAGALLLVVSSDGMIRGVQPHDTCPLDAVLRVDGDLVDVVQRLEDLAGEAEDLRRRVADLGDRAEGLDTGIAVEVAALKGRVRKLEARSR